MDQIRIFEYSSTPLDVIFVLKLFGVDKNDNKITTSRSSVVILLLLLLIIIIIVIIIIILLLLLSLLE